MSDTTRGTDGEPSDRAQQLLRTLVECYVRDGQPVGSRTLTRESGLSLSAATIRNVMADLEEHGFVSLAPHLGGPRADRQGLPLFRGCAPALPAAGTRRSRGAEAPARAAGGRLEGTRGSGLPAGVGPHAPGRRRDGAARNPLRALADRVRRPVGQPRADDPGGQRPRGPEPRGPARPPLQRRGTAPCRGVSQRVVCGPGTLGRARPAGRAAPGNPRADEPHDGRRDHARAARVRGRAAAGGTPTWSSRARRT